MLNKMKMIVVLGLILVTAFTTGCRKCYKCVAWDENDVFSNAQGNVSVDTRTRQDGIDTVAYYTALGYTWRRNYANYVPMPDPNQPPADICDKNQYHIYLNDRDSCWQVSN